MWATPPLLGQRSHLFVSEISRNITESLTVGVAANDGLTADFECVVEAFLRTMTQINHDAVLIHLLNHLDTKLADTIMEAAATCRVADVIVTVVAKGDIDYSTLGKMLHILKSVLQCQTVFNGKHDAVAAASACLRRGRTVCELCSGNDCWPLQFSQSCRR